MVKMISSRLKCLSMPYWNSGFIKEYEALKTEEKAAQIQSAAKSSDIYRKGLEELTLGELLALDGKDKVLQNKDLWKKKIIEASQDRGIILINSVTAEESFQTFLEAAQEMDAVKFLVIDTELTDSQMMMLVRALNPKYADSPLKLEGITLNMERELPEEIFERFLLAVAKNPTMATLRFDSYYLNNASVNQLSGMLKDLDHLKCLSIKHYDELPEPIQKFLAKK